MSLHVPDVAAVSPPWEKVDADAPGKTHGAAGDFSPYDSTLGEPLELDELVDLIRENLRAKSIKDSPLEERLAIRDAMSCVLSSCARQKRRNVLAAMAGRFDANSSGWLRYRFTDPDKKYNDAHAARNLIATDHDTFTLMLLCWNPGKESPIHDHPCRGCWMRALCGEVVETQYKKTDDTLEVCAVNRLHSPSTAFINDSIALHKVGASAAAADQDEPKVACTLHLYAPPFDACHIWPDAAHADKVAQPTVTYYSEYGERVDFEERAGICCETHGDAE